MSERYFGDWNDVQDIISDFRIDENDIQDSEIIFASYEWASYVGDALVIFERDGKLYEVNGSHCSCYGLEKQWEPEETSWQALKMRSDEWRKSKRYSSTMLHSEGDESIMRFLADLIDAKAAQKSS